MRAPRVLVSGVVLGQGAGGVRRHAAELLPRLARRLADAGGALAVLEGERPIDFALPQEVERYASGVALGPPLRRVFAERRALDEQLTAALVLGDDDWPFTDPSRFEIVLPVAR